jgi:hypothetical protein
LGCAMLIIWEETPRLPTWGLARKFLAIFLFTWIGYLKKEIAQANPK